MNKVLIGSTGFVGTNLSTQVSFDSHYNSKNINELSGKTADEIWCAGVSAVKWWANNNSSEDQRAIDLLWNVLKTTQAKRFVLISTVDVFKSPFDVDETTSISLKNLHPYGLHRRQLEIKIQRHFPNTVIIRLPGLYGTGLKKNLIFDLLNGKPIESFHSNSYFQFYSLNRIAQDVQISIMNNLPLIHLATEPVSVADIAQRVIGVPFQNITEAPAIKYDVKSNHASLFGGKAGYLENRNEVLEGIHRFARQ